MNTDYILFQDTTAPDLDYGGKAASLKKLKTFNIPDWFVVTPNAFLENSSQLNEKATEELQFALDQIDGELYAVRSSARDEDGSDHSFAGQLDSFLAIQRNDLPKFIAEVHKSAFSDRLKSYRMEHNLGECIAPAIIVQKMVMADAAGVAFAVDPVTCRWDKAIVSAVPGLGEALVDGSSDADTWTITRNNEITEKSIATQKVRLFYEDQQLKNTEISDLPSLTDQQVIEVASLSRQCSAFYGHPQDIEWAYENGKLYLLQSRPITTLMQNSDTEGTGCLWDCSNIAESYGGITTPLTYSFARDIYEAVYKNFCRLMGVSQTVINDQANAFRGLLGCMDGRIYYNLLNWYRLLSFFPGYQINRGFMEQMMGVGEALPDDMQIKSNSPTLKGKCLDILRLSKSFCGLLYNHFSLPRQIRHFQVRLNEALESPPHPWEQLSPTELCEDFRRLEKALLLKWDAPLVNDFFAMIFYGVLKKTCEKWLDDTNGALQNDLIGGDGNVISAEPARRVKVMANLAKQSEGLAQYLREGNEEDIIKAIEANPDFKKEYDEYQNLFADRCLEELKLESLTLSDNAMPLYRAIGHFAARENTGDENLAQKSRLAAEQKVEDHLENQKIKKYLFSKILHLARSRVANRENLRFDRTRLFGRIRKIFVELGRRYAAAGLLEEERDIFYLDKEEALGFVEGTISCTDIKALAKARKNNFEEFKNKPEPVERFVTRGWVFCGNDFTQPFSVIEENNEQDPTQRKGIGCCPGIVRGEVRVVRNPRGVELPANCILVAERTDPGWIMLFPAAAGLVVERGSLLSHSAIVSRELGLPAVVSVNQVTQWLKDGDFVEIDGSKGTVKILEKEESE